MPTISALTAGTTLAGTEAIPAVQSAATVKTTPNALKTLIAPLTTKGDVLAYSTVNVRVAVGANNTVLTADSTATPGVKWAHPQATYPVRGLATLSGGTVVVSTAAVTANSLIWLTEQALGTVTVPSALCVSARSVGVSFTILASQATDTSTVAWQIIEP